MSADIKKHELLVENVLSELTRKRKDFLHKLKQLSGKAKVKWLASCALLVVNSIPLQVQIEKAFWMGDQIHQLVKHSPNHVLPIHLLGF